jgi:tetratricopeptide (TPR) repeat protein
MLVQAGRHCNPCNPCNPCSSAAAIAGTLLLLLSTSGLVSAAQQPDPRARFFQEGARALAEHRYADAAQAYEALRTLSPEVAEVHASLGLSYFQQRKFTEAVPALRQALKLKPALQNVPVLLAMSLSELGHYDEALPGLEKGFAQSADPAVKRAAGLQLQRAYTGLRRDAQAVDVALQLTRLYPKDPELLYHASRLYANFAFVTLQKLSQVAPDSVWVHLAAGEANESQGLDDGALRDYRAVLALDPRRPGVHFRLGRVLLSRSQKDNSDSRHEAEALKEFQQELELDPTHASAAYEIGEIRRKAGELDKAREFFETALKYYPEFEEARVGLGRTLVALAKPELAVPHLQKAIALNAASEVAYYQLAQAYRALGDAPAQEKALAVFEQLQSASLRRGDAANLSRREVTEQTLDTKPPGKSPK